MDAPVQVRSGASAVRASRPGWAEITFAATAFAVLCIAVLSVAPNLVEPDDYAYRGSIVAMTQGHFLTLSAAQFHALSAKLDRSSGPRPQVRAVGPAGGRPGVRVVGQAGGPPGVAQWVRLPDGRWISEKDPGYPFLAAPFQLLGIIRFAPLFYGALGCLGLFFGARRWLGRLGGAAAVGLFCTSGAALLFAWRDYMPTFTEAGLIAAGTGALLWTLLATEASARRRIWTGLLGFVAIEAAVFSRYTNVVVLGCAVLAVLALRLRRPEILPRRALWWWLGSAVLFAAGVAVFNDLVYGGPLRSGYRPGEIRFGLGSVLPNLRYMPGHLIQVHVTNKPRIRVGRPVAHPEVAFVTVYRDPSKPEHVAGLQHGAKLIFDRVDSYPRGIWRGRFSLPTRIYGDGMIYGYRGTFAARFCQVRR